MSQRPKKSFGLTTQLLIPMLALVMVMGIFIFAWSFYLSKNTLKNELAMDIEKTRSIIELSLNNTLSDIKDDLIEITLNPEFKQAMESGTPDYIDQKLYNFMSSRQGYLLDVLTVYKDGQNWIEAGIIELPIIQLRNKFKNTMSTSPAWGYLSFRALENIRTMLICAVPVFNEQTGEVLGVLYGGIDLNSNVSFIDRLQKASSAINAILISKHRLIISTSNPTSNEIKKLIKWSTSINPGQFLIEDDLIFSSIQLMPEQVDSPLLFSFSRKNPAFQALKINYMQNLAILLSLTTLLAIFTSWGLQKRILNALKSLTDYARSAGKGERGTPFKKGHVKEFNQLGSTLESMVARLDENSTYISKLFFYAKAPIISCDLQGSILDLNPAAQKIAGFHGDLAHEYCLLNIFPKEYEHKLSRTLMLAAGGQTTPVAEIPIRSSTEEEKFFVWTFSPVQMDKDEEVIFILLQGQDVTERRKAMKKPVKARPV